MKNIKVRQSPLSGGRLAVLTAVLLGGLLAWNACASNAAPRKLFNGADLTGWYTYLKGCGKNCDPLGVFAAEQGVLKISGRELGALVSNEEFENYHLHLEYRFTGGEQFGWKKNGAAPDSGILFHSIGPDGAFGGLWMESLEANLILGCTGDFWGVGVSGKRTVSLSCRVGDRRLNGKYPVYDPKGTNVYVIAGNTRVCRSDISPDWRDRRDTPLSANERPLGEWNEVDLYCVGSDVTVKLNGHVVNRGFNAKPTKGRIQLQSEGCPIEFRNVTIEPAAVLP